MALARTVVSLVLLLRNKSKLNVRQPLSRLLLVEGVSGVRRDVVDSVRDIILDEVNVRNIEFIRDAGTVVSRTAKANFKSLGPRLGKQMKEAAARIAALDAVEISQFLEAGSLDLVIGETALTLGPEDMEIVSEELGGWSVAQEGRVTVALDTALTPELRQQGHARELVNRIQQLRKALDLALTDRIAVELAAPAEITAAVDVFGDYIRAEVLAESLGVVETPAGARVETVEIADAEVRIAISRLA
jgi:isoleucyl-tRNA synthetase